MAIPESNINQSPFTVAASPFLKPETPFFPQRTMIKGASVMEERAGFVLTSVTASSYFTFWSFTTITSQHCVLAHEGDHLTASKRVLNTSSETGSGLYFRILLLPLIASIKSIFYPPSFRLNPPQTYPFRRRTRDKPSLQEFPQRLFQALHRYQYLLLMGHKYIHKLNISTFSSLPPR